MAMNDKQNPEKRYIGQVYTALQAYSEFVDSNTVVAGDFNWNAIRDESPRSPLCGDFSATVECLHGNGLQSAYHTMTSSEFGTEEDPTFFMHRKQSKKYHTDYIFFPKEHTESVADFSVGAYDD